MLLVQTLGAWTTATSLRFNTLYVVGSNTWYLTGLPFLAVSIHYMLLVQKYDTKSKRF